MNLFELNDKFRELEKMEDVDSDILKDTLDSLEIDRNEKLDNIATWIEKNKSQIDWIKNKIADLRKMQKALTNKNDSLMQYLTDAIDDIGVKSIQTQNHVLKPRNYAPRVEILDETKIPARFVELETKTKIDKTEIRKAIQNGETVDGAEMTANRKTVIK